MSCVFCNLDCAVYLAENEHFFAVWDKFPISKGHALIISKRHVNDYFALNSSEQEALHALSNEVRAVISKKHEPQGFNLAMNCGAAAGQTVFHFHMHIIPRYTRDKVKDFSHLRESPL